jgi:hypothetical protein
VDFDDAAKTFVYDLKQTLKNPDWTYADQHSTKRHTVVTGAPEGEAGVRLAPDVWAAMKELADVQGIELDRRVNDALREWLKRGRK